MLETVISDTSCLIVLSKIGELDLLKKRYGHILIPSQVRKEFRIPIPDWIVVRDPTDESVNALNAFRLDPGERAAIALALEHPNSVLIADEEQARRIASLLNLTVTGTLGILVKAKKAGIIECIRPLIDRIFQETDFRVADSIVQKALLEAEEL